MCRVSFRVKFTSGSRICASRSELLKVPTVLCRGHRLKPIAPHSMKIWRNIESLLDFAGCYIYRSLKNSAFQRGLNLWPRDTGATLWPTELSCEDHSLLDFTSAVLYMNHFIYHFTFITHGLVRTHKWPAPNVSGFIAHLVRASHWYLEVTGSNSVEENFWGLHIRNCINCVHNCEDHSFLDC